jgi:undecaprenyl-diphosphatase
MKEIKFNTSFNLFKSKYSLLILIGVCFPLIIFALLAIAVIAYPQWLWWDVPILLAIHQTANPFLNQFAASVTNLGIYSGTIPVIITISLVLTLLKNWRSLLFVILTALGSIGLTYSMKATFHRPRPHLWENFYHLPSSYSFPSGHALSSMTLVIIIIILSWQTRWRTLSIILGSIFALIIGWTRLYLGVHYPSDIVGGWCLAIAWGIGLNLLIQKPQGLKDLKVM